MGSKTKPAVILVVSLIGIIFSIGVLSVQFQLLGIDQQANDAAQQAVSIASSNEFSALQNLCAAYQAQAIQVSNDPTMTQQQKQSAVANITAMWNVDYQLHKSHGGADYNCPITGSTTIPQPSPSIKNSGGNNSLYFLVSCVGCSNPTRGSFGISCPGNYSPAYFGSWGSRPWYQNQFGGDMITWQGFGMVANPIFGNGTASYVFSPDGKIAAPPNYPYNYQGTPIGADFEIFSCQGTLSLKLMSGNGTMLWNATALPTSLNGTVSWVYSGK